MGRVFHRDVDKALNELFRKHCNLSGEQYLEIHTRLTDIVKSIKEGWPVGDVETEAEELSIIFEFLLHTKELTAEEYNVLCNYVSDMLDEASEKDRQKTFIWKECAEKLPEEPGNYLVVISGVHGYRERRLASFFRSPCYTGKKEPGWFEMGKDGYKEVPGVTHWIELPDMPEE
jgi:hypothetical protein